MAEVLLTTPHFKSFNEFFYRKLKPTARPCSAPTDPHIVVSPADARSVVFNRMEAANSVSSACSATLTRRTRSGIVMGRWGF